jgi:hypothetical protein
VSAESIWQALEAGPRPAHRRIDDIHPFDFYFGVDDRGARELVLVATRPPSRSSQRFKAFEIIAGVREDGRFTLTTRLRRPELRVLFGHLCEDLIESARDRTDQEVMTFVQERIGRWETLFARDSDGLLDERALRGLLSELLFLRDFALPAIGPRRAVHAWRGPLGNDHDFEFAGVAVEVKSVTESRVVTISSVEQLDESPKPLRLSVFQLERSISDAAPAFSAGDIVGGLRTALVENSHAGASFNEKLALAGFVDHHTYSTRWYTLSGVSHFQVVPGFPRIRRVDLIPGVVDLRYGVDLRQCEQYALTSLDLAP